MVLETKFGIKDKVYVLDGSKIINSSISHIFVSVDKDIKITYELDTINERYLGVSFPKTFTENQLFKTKEELIQSLI